MKAFYSKFFLGTALLCLIPGLSSCREKPQQVSIRHGQPAPEEKADPFVKGNQRILALEQEEINLVVKRHKWQMEATGTGLMIQILSPGTGNYYAEGDSLSYNYKIKLLSGEEIYNSEKDGIKTFRIDKTEEIPALHEAAKLLKPQAKARLVIPSHLAYGATGDGQRIKGREALIMEVECLSLN